MSERKYSCGCVVTSEGDSRLVGLVPCEEHGGFSTVRKAFRMLQSALEEAHEQLPPGPENDQEQRRAG